MYYYLVKMDWGGSYTTVKGAKCVSMGSIRLSVIMICEGPNDDSLTVTEIKSKEDFVYVHCTLTMALIKKGRGSQRYILYRGNTCLTGNRRAWLNMEYHISVRPSTGRIIVVVLGLYAS